MTANGAVTVEHVHVHVTLLFLLRRPLSEDQVSSLSSV